MSGNPPTRRSPGPTILYVLASICLLVVVVKASVIGYYDSDLPWMAVVLVAGLAMYVVAKRWGES